MIHELKCKNCGQPVLCNHTSGIENRLTVIGFWLCVIAALIALFFFIQVTSGARLPFPSGGRFA